MDCGRANHTIRSAFLLKGSVRDGSGYQNGLILRKVPNGLGISYYLATIPPRIYHIIYATISVIKDLQAFLYYDFWWDTGRIKTETSGIEPTSDGPILNQPPLAI